MGNPLKVYKLIINKGKYATSGLR